ncbi:hypothetical protein OA86_14350 [Kaistella jeonii]|uniref:Uncharacterized protein n=1 Tax=Kaistella jeonii TaxID=266749 RepID=A0A0C1EYT3_9FLAO|nr:hypothetical protein OA86_14350 [Kaistella jeonii]
MVSFFVIAIANYFDGLQRFVRNNKKDITESGYNLLRSENLLAPLHKTFRYPKKIRKFATWQK